MAAIRARSRARAGLARIRARETRIRAWRANAPDSAQGLMARFPQRSARVLRRARARPHGPARARRLSALGRACERVCSLVAQRPSAGLERLRRSRPRRAGPRVAATLRAPRRLLDRPNPKMPAEHRD